MPASRFHHHEVLNSLLEKASVQGYLTTDDLIEFAPEFEDAERLSVLMLGLRQQGVEVLEADAAEAGPESGAETWVEEVDAGGSDTVGMYLKEMSRVPLLTAAEEYDLAVRIQEGRSARTELLRQAGRRRTLARRRLEMLVQDGLLARDHLIKANTRLVVSVAKKYIGRGVPFLDLIQEGNLGLMKAVEKYDVTRGFRFSTYATWWVRQMITRALADQARTIRLPVHMSDRIRQVYRATHALEQRLGRVPTAVELANELHLEPKRLETILNSSRIPLSLDSPVGEGEDSDLGMFIEDEFSPTPMQAAYQVMLKEKVNEVLESLTPREARVLRLRFGLDDGNAYTLEEVGEKFGLTRERIRQIEGKALRRLRHPLRARQLKEYL
ncbi:MAG: sigma-70 family RNA polymerase sigma factor [Chloroflexota bacterium]